MAKSHKTGKAGEQRALAYLEEHGFRVLETNWRHEHLELDIVAIHEEMLVIVEVKTRSSAEYGTPETFVHPVKQSRLIRAANHYIGMHGLDYEIRFDIVAILLSEEGESIDHLPDAFGPRVR